MKKRIIFTVLALLIFISFGFLYVYKLKKEMILTVKVPIAAQTITSRSEIKLNDIEYIEIVDGYLLDNIETDINNIVGKYLDIYATIPKGSLFYKDLLEDIDELPDEPHLKLKNDQASFSIITDLNQLSGNTIVEGQHVDVYVSIAQRNEKPIFDLLINNVRVLSVKDRKGLDLNDPKSSKIPYICVLAVSTNSLPLLSNASKIGNIELYVTSNSYNDLSESVINENSIVLDYLIG